MSLNAIQCEWGLDGSCSETAIEVFRLASGANFNLCHDHARKAEDFAAEAAYQASILSREERAGWEITA